MPTRIDKIIKLIKEEASTVSNPDPCARLYNVSMQIENKLIDEMIKIREQKENADKDGSITGTN